MKKVLAFLMTAVLVISASVCVAFAAPSPEALGVISGITVTDKNSKKVDVKVEKIDKKVDKKFTNELAVLKNETKKKNLKVIGHYDVTVSKNATYPLSVVLDVLGISASSDVYVLAQRGGKVVTITPTVKNGKVIFDLDESVDKIALVTDKKTADKVEKETGVLSPQTSESISFVVMMFVAAVAMLFVSKKVKA